MSSTLVHTNPSIFPDPSAFNPDRWLQASSPSLNRYLIAFSRWFHQCAGTKYVCHSKPQTEYLKSADDRLHRSLAYCEMDLALAALFAPGRFEFKPFETSRYGIELADDFFSPCFRLETGLLLE